MERISDLFNTLNETCNDPFFKFIVKEDTPSSQQSKTFKILAKINNNQLIHLTENVPFTDAPVITNLLQNMCLHIPDRFKETCNVAHGTVSIGDAGKRICKLLPTLSEAPLIKQSFDLAELRGGSNLSAAVDDINALSQDQLLWLSNGSKIGRFDLVVDGYYQHPVRYFAYYWVGDEDGVPSGSRRGSHLAIETDRDTFEQWKMYGNLEATSTQKEGVTDDGEINIANTDFQYNISYIPNIKNHGNWVVSIFNNNDAGTLLLHPTNAYTDIESENITNTLEDMIASNIFDSQKERLNKILKTYKDDGLLLNLQKFKELHMNEEANINKKRERFITIGRTFMNNPQNKNDPRYRRIGRKVAMEEEDMYEQDQQNNYHYWGR